MKTPATTDDLRKYSKISTEFSPHFLALICRPRLGLRLRSLSMFACNTLLVRSTKKGWETSSTLFLRVVKRGKNVRRKNAVENKRKRAEWRRRQSARVRRERTRREGWWCWSFSLVSRWEKRRKASRGRESIHTAEKNTQATHSLRESRSCVSYDASSEGKSISSTSESSFVSLFLSTWL